MHTPVLLLAFNRPEQTSVVLDRMRMVQPRVVYVHIDGPRTDRAGESALVQSVQQVIESGIDWPCTVHRLYRPHNAGLRAGVYEALNWFFEVEPAGIVLEDDCVPDPSFFRFCSELLEKYAQDDQIMHIGGSNLIQEITQTRDNSYLFTSFSFVWGWASWRRAWQKMKIDLDGLVEYQASGAIRDFISDPMAQVYMLDKFRSTQAKKNNSWAYAWFYSILKNKGLCIVSAVNLIENTGIGQAGATHTQAKNEKAQVKAAEIRFPLKHPDKKNTDALLEKQFFYSSQKSRLRLWIWYLLKKAGLR